MGIAVSCILIMLGTLSAVLGISFYIRNVKYARDISCYILLYGIMATFWCLGYGLIGVTEDLTLCGYLRIFGVVGIAGFLTNECFFVIDMAKLPRIRGIIMKFFMLLISLVEVFFYADTGVDSFVRIGSWTTWYVNPDYSFNRQVHVAYMILSFFILFSLAMLWVKGSTLKRQKKFIDILIISNFLLTLFAIPDTLMPMLGRPALTTSGIGAALCTAVVWYGATQLNYFDIRMGNIGGRIIDFIDAGVIVFDTKGRAIITNTFCKKAIGDLEITGAGIDSFFEVKDLDVEAMYTKALSEEIFSGRLPGKYNDNVYSVRLNALNDDYGAPFCFLCVFADVTEEMRMIKKVEEASSAKSTFLAQMSHEIRTPIHVIMGMNEMIMRESEDKDIAEYSANIESAGNTLLSLINSILDFSKIEDGKMDIVPVRYDTASLINDLVNSGSSLSEEKDISFKVNIDETLPCTLIGDDLRLSQVIMNLITNAVKYTEQGEVSLTIRLDGRIDRKALIFVAVKDTGMGIKEEDIARIFESFERIDEIKNRNIEGTGLGISIVKDILRLMNSRLRVDSTYGKGSIFYSKRQK